MNKYGSIKNELDELIILGRKICESICENSDGEISDMVFFVLNYEKWYSKALPCIKILLPERLDDFVRQYRNERRKEISRSNYTISDALRETKSGIFYGPEDAGYCILTQTNILEACKDVFDSRIHNIQTILQADVFDSEIESAEHLLNKGFYRAAGAICGVIIEKHLSECCKSREISIKRKNPTIADYNDALKDNAYDTIEWRRIQRLGDIRNLCDHSKDREPTKDEVTELISGTQRLIKTIF